MYPFTEIKFVLYVELRFSRRTVSDVTDTYVSVVDAIAE